MKVHTITQHNNNDDQWVIGIADSLEKAKEMIAEFRKDEVTDIDLSLGAHGIHAFFADDGLSYFVEEYELNKLLE